MESREFAKNDADAQIWSLYNILFSGGSSLNSGNGGSGQVAAVAAAAAMNLTNTTNQQDLASLFECPVCFDYVLPPILQVSSTPVNSSTKSLLKTAHVIFISTVSRRPPRLFLLPTQTDLLPHMPRPAGRKYQKLGNGKSCLDSHVPL